MMPGDGDGPDMKSPAEDASEGGFFVDRIEGDKAVIMAGTKSVVIPASALPKGAKEGSYFDASGQLMSDPDDGATNAMRSQLAAGDDGGDIDLGGEPNGDPDDVMPPSPMKVKGVQNMTRLRR